MKKFFVYFALFIAVFFVLSCGESEEDGEGSACTTQGDLRCNGNMLQKCDQEAWKNFENCADSGKTCNANQGACTSGGSSSGDNGSGIYLGIIGFNTNLNQTKEIARLTNYNDFTNFIEGLNKDTYTALYLAADTALDMMQKYNKPPKLEHVALVTFTDGIDNQSIAGKPEYNTKEEYLEVIHNKIVNEKIHGLPVEAYSIGFNSETEMSEDDKNYFDTQLKKLASSGNDFQSSNMQEVQNRFAQIAANLSKVSKTVDMGLYMAGGYNEGFVIRYTFDNVDKAESSKLYIEGVYRKQAGKLENISYQGFKAGESSIQAQKTSDNTLYFMFKDLRYSNGDNVPDDLYRSAKLWYKMDSKSDWVGEIELDMGDMDPIVEVDMSSALIMLVLDCTKSLSDENFRMMKNAAEEFVRTLANASGNGGGSGNNTEPTDPTTNPGNDLNCGEIYQCMVDCGSDGDCQQGCYDKGSANGKTQIMALIQCLNTCSESSATDDEFQECATSQCSSEISNCEGLGGGAAGDTSYASPYGSAQINISSTYIVTDADSQLGQEMVTMGSFISGNYGSSQIVPAAAAQSYYYTSMYTEDGETMMQTAQYFTDSTGQNILNPFVIAITNVEASVGSNYYGLLDQNGVGYIMLADVTVSGNSLNLSCYHAFSEGELTVQNLYAAAGSAGALAVSGTVNLYSPKNYANGYGDISDQLGVTVCSPK